MFDLPAILTGIGAMIAALFAAVMWGRQGGKASAKVDALEAEQDAHERANNADTGIGATDADRIKRLRDFAERHGN